MGIKSALLRSKRLIYTDIGENGGIFEISLETEVNHCILPATAESSPYGLCIANDVVFYSDIKKRQIFSISCGNSEEVVSKLIAGTGNAKRVYGLVPQARLDSQVL